MDLKKQSKEMVTKKKLGKKMDLKQSKVMATKKILGVDLKK